MGWLLDTELNLTDLGVSGYRGKNVKAGALGVFLKAIYDGTVPRGSYLLIENVDRLTRDEIPQATMLFLQIITAGVTVVTLSNQERYSQERLAKEPHAIYFIVSELIRANQESFREVELVAAAKERRRTRLAMAELSGRPYTRQTPGWIKWSDGTPKLRTDPRTRRSDARGFHIGGPGMGS